MSEDNVKPPENWEEYLNIFLFKKLIKDEESLDQVKIKDYSEFELTDKLIKDFNQFLERGDFTNIHDWRSEYSDQVEEFRSNFEIEYERKAVLWSDREKPDYFKEKLNKGKQFEDYIEKLFKDEYDLDLGPYTTPEGQYEKGENEMRIEIKYDMKCKETGNLYIEYAEKLSGNKSNYVNSGILKDDNSKYFLIGDFEKFWIFRKERLIEIYEEEIKKGRSSKSSRGIRFIQKPTSKGFIYPIEEAKKETIPITQVVKELKQN